LVDPAFATPDPGDIARARALARMRRIATGLLILMAAVFIAASLGQARWPDLATGLGYVQAFAEAAMVGACADWFAVTALFRHPFGLPIPHTGIIPRNKDRIGQSLGGFIADNFLTEAVLEEKLRRFEVARWGGDWLREPENAQRTARRLAVALPRVLAALPRGALRDLAASGALGALRAAPAAAMASRLLDALWRDGRGERLIDTGLDFAAAYLAERGEDLEAQVARQAPAWMPRWADKIIAGQIGKNLLKTLRDMRDPEHPLRARIRTAVEDFIRRLAEDPKLQADVESWKQRLIDDPVVRSQASEVWAALEAGFTSGLAKEPRLVAERLEKTLAALGSWLAEDPMAQKRLNEGARALALQGIAPRRHEIGLFVAQVVASWDARSLVDKLELQVGKDLQYIRINGTVVGGLVGLAIHALAQAFSLS
jgi:uncharacterized membrane-anchored protein YjiN (DUF445 family)